jgi:cell division septation protein DedD
MKQLPHVVLALSLPLVVMADNFLSLGQKAQPECAPCTQEEKPATSTSTPATPKMAAQGRLEPGYWVQIGAFKTAKALKKQMGRAQQAGWSVKSAPAGALTRVLIGPFESRRDAKEVLHAARSLEPKAFIRSGF